MISIAQNPFSTLRLLAVPPDADPSVEPLLAHAGVLIEAGEARSAWDGINRASALDRKFLTASGNDLTGPELAAIANRLNGRPAPLGLSEAARARVGRLLEEAGGLLGTGSSAEHGPGAP